MNGLTIQYEFISEPRKNNNGENHAQNQKNQAYEKNPIPHIYFSPIQFKTDDIVSAKLHV